MARSLCIWKSEKGVKATILYNNDSLFFDSCTLSKLVHERSASKNAFQKQTTETNKQKQADMQLPRSELRVRLVRSQTNNPQAERGQAQHKQKNSMLALSSALKLSQAAVELVRMCI